MGYLKQYLAAIWADWVSRMSGVAGLLLIVIAFAFRLTEVGQARYWLGAAAACFVIASFSAWRTERLNAERLRGIIESLEQVSDTLSLSPLDVVKVYEGRTTIQGEKLATTYIGKWLTISGQVYDADKDAFGRTRILIDPTNDLRLILAFAERFSESVGALRKGDAVTARGKIRVVSSNVIHLEDCEIIKV